MSFDQTYADWLTARADVARLDALEDLTDDRFDGAVARQGDCELAMITIPAKTLVQIMNKAAAAEALACEAKAGGQFFDNRDVRLLASLRVDLAAFYEDKTP